MTARDGGAMRWHSVWPVWALAVAAAAAIAVLVPEDRTAWLPIALGACVVASFAVQLGLPTVPGLVDRLFASVVGAVLVLAAASAVFAVAAIVV